MSVRTAIASVTLAALALASGTAAAPPVPGPGQITAGTGCSVQCVLKALVTPTASYANVAIETLGADEDLGHRVAPSSGRGRGNIPVVGFRHAALGVPSGPRAGDDVQHPRQGN